jgi:hypothetical protein
MEGVIVNYQHYERIYELNVMKRNFRRTRKMEYREICGKREIRQKCFPEKKFFWKLSQRQCPTMKEFSPGIAEYYH